MKKFLVLAVLGCGPVPGSPKSQEEFKKAYLDTTVCGMQTINPFTGTIVDLERLQKIEDVVLKELAFAGVTCEKLKGWKIYPQTELAWTDEYGRFVAGLCYCETKIIKVDRDWRVIPHELIHAADCPIVNYHVGWDTNGIFAKLKELEARKM